MSGNPPSITDWIGSIGTAAGFLIASISFAYDRYSRRLTDRLAQARLIDGWLTSPELGEREIKGKMYPTLTFTVLISNSSQEVARHVRIQVNPWDKEPVFPGFRASVGIVPPTRADQPFSYIQAFTAGIGFPDDIDFQMASWRGYDLVLRFTDTVGQRWIRQPDGSLKPTVDVAAEEKAEHDEMERRFPGISKAEGWV